MLDLDKVEEIHNKLISELIKEIKTLREDKKNLLISINKLNNEYEVLKRENEHLKNELSDLKGDYSGFDIL